MAPREAPEARVVAITGGARGIGLAIARELAQRGAMVCLGDLDPIVVKVAEAEGMIGYGGLDVADPEQFDGFLAFAEDQLGPLDVVVNNAGVLAIGPVEQESHAATTRMLDTNVLGVINGTKLALRRMLPRGRGHIVNIASLSGEMPVAGGATYSATKHAVVGFTEAARLEHRGSGVHLSAVLPTLVNTQMIAGAGRARGVSNAEPEHVARAVAGLLERPRPTVRVTRLAGSVATVYRVTPRRIWEPLAHLVGLDEVFTTAVDHSQRAAYELALAQGAPDPGEHTRGRVGL